MHYGHLVILRVWCFYHLNDSGCTAKQGTGYMRIHNRENDSTADQMDLYLTTSEAARLYGLLGSMLADIRVKDFSVSDEGLNHTLRVHLYNEFESSGFDQRQKSIIADDQ